MDKHNLVRHVLRMQMRIAYLIFLVFLVLVIYALTPWARDQVLNIFVPVVVGWLGAIIGFYFSKEVGNAIEQKIMGVKSEGEQEMLAFRQEFSRVAEALQQKEQELIMLKKQYGHLGEEYRSTVESLRKYYESGRLKSASRRSP